MLGSWLLTGVRQMHRVPSCQDPLHSFTEQTNRKIDFASLALVCQAAVSQLTWAMQVYETSLGHAAQSTVLLLRRFFPALPVDIFHKRPSRRGTRSLDLYFT